MDSHLSTSAEGLPQPPAEIPPNVVPEKAPRFPMERRGLGSRGQKTQLMTNHFTVQMSKAAHDFFFNYSVAITYEDGNPVEGRGIGRKVIDKVKKTYDSEIGMKDLAYDGEKTLFTIGPLPNIQQDFTVVLEDMPTGRKTFPSPDNGNPNQSDNKRVRRPFQSKIYKVSISFAAKIPVQAIADALRGRESENSQEALRVLDIVLRQHASRQGCLLVRQSFFHNDPKNFVEVGGGVLGCRGFHSSFRAAQGGLSLNIDVSTTMIVKPGPLIDFLLENQGVNDPYGIDWAKAKRVLKNLRVKVMPSELEYRITGLSDDICKRQMFSMKPKGGKNGGDDATEISVYEYFVNYKDIPLRYSGDLPCLNVGRGKRPTYQPIELCTLISLQRYTKALSTFQRSSLVEKSRQKPQERMRALSEALRLSNYSAEPLLKSSGVSISSQFTQIEGRVLSTPRLKVGNGEDCFPRNGRWNFNNKQLAEPAGHISRWIIVNFSARCDMRFLVQSLIKCAQMKGMEMDQPHKVFEEDPQCRRNPPVVRVEKMAKTMQDGLPGAPKFILCILPERKNSDLYGPWKKRNLADFGVATQCIAPGRINDQYLTNVLLKINVKLGGLNSLLAVELSPSIPIVSKAPTMILGMDVSHGSPGSSDIPSIAAVVGSRLWPRISRYRASVRTQSPKVEMIDSLYKLVEKDDQGKTKLEDKGIMREMLIDFYTSSQKRKPENIIIFRDGVSESQFNQVLNVEFDQILEACKFLDEKWAPKFVIVVAQKNHHTKFFQANSPDNVPPGTIIDSRICHPKQNDFYLCAHAGMIGTTRPTHYHVLLDEIGFSPDDLQELVHSLSYVYQRSTTAISVVAPICYAHLAASQMGQFIKFESQTGTHPPSQVGQTPVPQLPLLDEKVANSMFFC